VVGILALVFLSGCALTAPAVYFHALLGPEGQPILLEEVVDIVGDSDLTDDEKREELRELGIKDEELIDALLGP